MSVPIEPADPAKPEPGNRPAGAGTRPSGAPTKRDDDDEDEWRHEPVAQVDETNPLRSLGKAVGDTVTGSGPDTASIPDTPASSKR